MEIVMVMDGRIGLLLKVQPLNLPSNNNKSISNKQYNNSNNNYINNNKTYYSSSSTKTNNRLLEIKIPTIMLLMTY